MNQDTQDVSGPPPAPRRGFLARLVDGLRRPLRRRGLSSSIGRYRVVRKIGEGGMGTVFEAVDEVLGRRVAIKRLKAVDESGRRRFWREARAVARLSHPNVCQLYEVGEDVSGPFLAMELLSGEPLSQRLRERADERRGGRLARCRHARRAVGDPRGRARASRPEALERVPDSATVRACSTSASCATLPSELARMMPSTWRHPARSAARRSPTLAI